MHAYEAMECLGGNGVIEEFITARLYRDAPINAIWEGSGNVQALDVLRALAKTPDVLEAWLAELDKGLGENATLDAAVDAPQDRARSTRTTPNTAPGSSSISWR